MIAQADFASQITAEPPEQTLLFGDTSPSPPPAKPKKKPVPHSLDAGAAELVRRRLEKLEGPEYSAHFQGMDLDSWEAFCRVMCPERYAVPEELPEQPTTLWGPLKTDVMESRLKGANGTTRQNPLKQKCLWHFLDFNSRPNYCEDFCAPGFGKKKRQPPKARTVDEKVASGQMEPPTFYHKGMARLEDAMMPEEDDYDPAEYLRREKGDVLGGEAARVYREVRA